MPPKGKPVMNFFQAQAIARRRALLPLAACVLFVAGYFLLSWWYWKSDAIALYIALCCLWNIGFGIWFCARPHEMARLLGGRPIDWTTATPQERRLRNVVEEMAIASGMPPPALYLAERQPSINAFPLGLSARNAVLVVTDGALQRLKRDELQGLVAHEYSLITGGDLPVQALLFGLMLAVAPVLMLLLVLMFVGLVIALPIAALKGRIRQRSGELGAREAGLLAWSLVAAAIVAFGAFGPAKLGMAAILVLGLASFAGLFITYPLFLLVAVQATRQRVFHGDARAVQYTRYPNGIGGALLVLSKLPEGAQYWEGDQEGKGPIGFMAFAESGRPTFRLRLLGTHPRVADRLRRVFNGPVPGALTGDITWRSGQKPPGMLDWAERETAPPAPELPKWTIVAAEPDAVLDTAGTISPESLSYAGALLAVIPADVAEALNSADGAATALFALMLEEPCREAQLRALGDPALHARVESLEATMRFIDRRLRLPLAEIALSRLAPLPGAERQRLTASARALIEADRRVTLAEFTLYGLIAQRLASRRPRAAQLAPASLDRRRGEALLVLSLLVRAGGRAEVQQARDFRAACEALALPGGLPMAGRESFKPDRLLAALERLSDLAPEEKQRLLRAMLRAVFADDKASIDEVELMRTLSAALGVPLPPVLGMTRA